MPSLPARTFITLPEATRQSPRGATHDEIVRKVPLPEALPALLVGEAVVRRVANRR